MPRWLWFAPLAILTVGGALLAFRMGWLAAHITETDAILAQAARYVDRAGPGAQAADCHAVPGQGGRVWIAVICAPPGQAGWRFDVDRFGRLIRETAPGQAVPPEGPST